MRYQVFVWVGERLYRDIMHLPPRFEIGLDFKPEPLAESAAPVLVINGQDFEFRGPSCGRVTGCRDYLILLNPKVSLIRFLMTKIIFSFRSASRLKVYGSQALP